MAGISAAHNRAKNLKQQIVPHTQTYAPVAIPQAYAPVYAGQAASTKLVNAPVYAQPPMPYQAQQQQWVHPSMMQGILTGQVPPHMVQPGPYQQYPAYQGTPPPMMNAGYHPPPQQYMQAQQPTSTSPTTGQIPSTAMPIQQPVQQPQAVEQTAQQPAQQPVEQLSSQEGWQQSMTAPLPAQEQQVQPDAQQTHTPPQQGSAVPSQQPTPVPTQQPQPPPSVALPSLPGTQQQFTVTPDVVPASPVRLNDAHSQIHQPSPVKPQIGFPSDQNVPRSAFAVQTMPEQSQLQPPQSSNGDLMPQRQTSGASQVSSLTTEPTTHKGSPDIQRAQMVQSVQTPVSVHSTRPASPERQMARVTLRDDPLPKVDTPVASAHVDKDDLYGATPRQSAVAAQEQYPIEHIIISEPARQSTTDESESKFAGMPAGMIVETKPEAKVESPAQQHFVVDSAPVISGPRSATPPPETSPVPPANLLVRSKSNLPEEEPPSPTESELKPEEANRDEETNENGKTTINGKPVQSSQEIFDEHKRKQLVRDMEEKIAVMPEPELLEPPKKTEDVPMMSATSYPGQEWNPYGDGFEEDDE